MHACRCSLLAARWCGPSLAIDADAGTWRWLVSLAFPPFAFELTLASSAARSDESHPFANIGDLLAYADEAKGDLELEMPVTCAHTIFPSDWRTRTQVELDLDMYGRPTGGS